MASPGLEGGQVAILRQQRGGPLPRNESSLLLSEGNVCAPWHKARQSGEEAPDLLRISLPRNPVNRSKIRAEAAKNPGPRSCSYSAAV